MSRRARRGKPPAASESDREQGRRAPADDRSRPPVGPQLVRDIAVLAAVFVVTVLVAEVLGAANLGVALGVGQIAFAVALVFILLRR